MKISFDSEHLFEALEDLNQAEQIDIACELTRMINPSDVNSYIDEHLRAIGLYDDEVSTNSYIDQIYFIKGIKGFDKKKAIKNVINIMDAYDLYVEDIANHVGLKVSE